MPLELYEQEGSEAIITAIRKSNRHARNLHVENRPLSLPSLNWGTKSQTVDSRCARNSLILML
jgi:hypothetical protein